MFKDLQMACIHKVCTKVIIVRLVGPRSCRNGAKVFRLGWEKLLGMMREFDTIG